MVYITKEVPSTINEVELAKLPAFECPPGRHLSTREGSGCFMDPPGFPSYFIRSVYTPCGDSPQRGADSVIFGRVLTVAEWPEGETWESNQAKHNKLLRKLYSPPPVASERVQAWARYVAGYFKGGVLPLSGSRNVSDLKFLSLADIKRELDEGGLTLERCRVADYILEHYPDFPRDTLYALCTDPAQCGYGNGNGSWWERLEVKPTPDKCPGGTVRKHPVNNSWCQVCGWEGER